MPRARKIPTVQLRGDFNSLGILVPTQLDRDRTPPKLRCQCQIVPRGDSALVLMEQTAARPKSGRPLQNLPPTTPGGFVAAVPSRAFRDGTGTFVFKLSHYLSPRGFVVPRAPSFTSFVEC